MSLGFRLVWYVTNKKIAIELLSDALKIVLT